jgi:hypothetical protein
MVYITAAEKKLRTLLFFFFFVNSILNKSFYVALIGMFVQTLLIRMDLSVYALNSLDERHSNGFQVPI